MKLCLHELQVNLSTMLTDFAPGFFRSPHLTANAAPAAWYRKVLLIILGYEAAGCLLGGSLLIAAPDGHLMDIPVDMMHGAFTDFLIPGVLLFGLGMLNVFAFLAVLRKSTIDWLLTSLALGGLFIWFWVEIAILREVHWLHGMWGIPVLLGWIVAIPLIVSRHDFTQMRNTLLGLGILSSCWYLAINIFVPLYADDYQVASFTVSELSAVDSSTRILWVLLVLPYPLLFAAFGWGVLYSAAGNRKLMITGTLILAYSIFNFYWPPMHQREVIASGGGSLTDTLHIAWASITILLMLAIMGFGATTAGRLFRLYTLVTFVIFIVCGILIAVETPGIDHGTPTPWLGIWERINIAAFMGWIVMFAIVLRQTTITQMHAGFANPSKT
jgi:hypothetical protein